MSSLVVLVIGPDRPGLVEMLASTIAKAEGNWQQSRMSRLAGQFAGILRVEVPEGSMQALTERLEALGDQGLEVFVRRSDAAPTPELRHAHMDLVGSDRPGIIRRISQALTEQHISVDELDTEVAEAPMSGEPIFRARARLTLPPEVDVGALRTTLEALGADMMVDIKLEELT